MKVIAVGGEPGTGKTTLMKKFMESADDWVNVKPVKLVDAMYSKSKNLYVLGKYEDGEVFAGTDRLSMSVQPSAVEFIKSCESDVLFEGDRLFNGSFLEFLSDNSDLFILYLQTSEQVRQSRYEERGSNQSEKFLRGRETKYNNLKCNFILRSHWETFTNENEEQQAKILSRMEKIIAS